MGQPYKDKWAALHLIATDPDMTAREVAARLGVARHTVEKWCRDEGVSLSGHKHPRVSFVLAIKQKKLSRLIKDLAKTKREVEELRKLDPNAPYRAKKPRKAGK